MKSLWKLPLAALFLALSSSAVFAEGDSMVTVINHAQGGTTIVRTDDDGRHHVINDSGDGWHIGEGRTHDEVVLDYTLDKEDKTLMLSCP